MIHSTMPLQCREILTKARYVSHEMNSRQKPLHLELLVDQEIAKPLATHLVWRLFDENRVAAWFHPTDQRQLEYRKRKSVHN